MASRGDDDRYGGGGAGAGAGAGGDAAFADSGDDRAAAILREGEAAIEDAAGARTDGAGGHGGSGGALANPLVGDLLRALRNEKAAPDLLPFQGDLVGTLSDMLAAQRAVLDSTPRSRLAAFDTVAALYEADVARLRYLLALYLRTRLAKVRLGRRKGGGGGGVPLGAGDGAERLKTTPHTPRLLKYPLRPIRPLHRSTGGCSTSQPTTTRASGCRRRRRRSTRGCWRRSRLT